MSEMVERVARKLFEREQSLPGESEVERAQWAEYYRWDGPNFKGQDHWRDMARAAIEAMLKELDAAPYKYSWFDAYGTLADAIKPKVDA